MPNDAMRKLQTDEMGRLDPAQFQAAPKQPVALILDNVRSLNNVGSAFRTADAFRAAQIWLCGITGTPPHREIEKTALGATESVTWQHAPDTAELVRQLRSEGWTIVAVEQTDSPTYLHEMHFEAGRPYAFVFGNELFGVSDEVLACCDLALEIPQFGTKHSLNVSVTIGVVLWEYQRQR